MDNALIFDDVIDSKDKLGQKTLHYVSRDNNTLLKMMGRIGHFKARSGRHHHRFTSPEEDQPHTAA